MARIKVVLGERQRIYREYRRQQILAFQNGVPLEKIREHQVEEMTAIKARNKALLGDKVKEKIAPKVVDSAAPEEQPKEQTTLKE